MNQENKLNFYEKIGENLGLIFKLIIAFLVGGLAAKIIHYIVDGI